MWVRPLAKSDASCGGKAVGLARLIAAGLPVPAGFVIEAGAFDSIVGERAALDEVGHALEHAAAQIAAAPSMEDVVEAAKQLGNVLAVRSSAAIEDSASGSAAGVFASVTNVAPRDVWSAIRAVWTSALTPLAAAYGRGRPLAIGVIVQRFIAGERITIYTRPPGAPDGKHLVAQRGEFVREYQRDDVDPFVALALRAEHAIAATRGADVELVIDREGALWIVQARPIVHPPPPARRPPPPALLGALVADGRRWTWDVTHNPDPLSPAQTSLVERVERAQIAPWSMRVCAGYLYSTPLESRLTDAANFHERAAAIEARVADIVDTDDALDVASASARYLAFYEVWARELVPLIAAARRGATPAQLVGARPSAVEATLLAAARGEIGEDVAIERLAPLAPTWDVAVPTFGERPEIIRAAIARAKDIEHISRASDRDERNEVIRAAADLAERDDLWFAKAQRLVRRALLARASELGVDEGDICWLSLDDLGAELDPDDVRRRASAAKAAYDRSSKWAMPLVIGDDVIDDRPALRGHGSGVRISGRVVRFESLARAMEVTRGDVIVTRAITPALAVFVVGCAAIVSETGGPLDHGAAIARELGVPFVVGCKDAWSLLQDGMIVTIDADVVSVA
ncbi:MAG: PEP-utilizing enzyme [Myxococcota bacterium]|nr:PEP-utilizing enzyme [Myxococcota bacterium]